MIRRAAAVLLLSGAALVFAFRFEAPPATFDADDDIVVVTTVTTSTLPPQATTPHVRVTIPPPGEVVYGPAIQVVQGPTVQMNRGYVQVEVTVFDGRVVDVDMITVPSESRRAREISLDAHRRLRVEALDVQTSRVHNVSGATETSRAWVYSLKVALIEAGVMLEQP